MIVLVCGSREWRDVAAIRAALRELPRGTKVIHGGARGADTIAHSVALSLGIAVEVFPANWRHGRGAGIARNRRMLAECPDLVLAFQLDGSRGTQDTIDEARRREIPTTVYAEWTHA